MKKFKKLPYEASYKTLLKRFPDIGANEIDGCCDEEHLRTMNYQTPYNTEIDWDFYKRHGLCYIKDVPLWEGHGYCWGADERNGNVQTCAKFIYLITEHFKDCHFITPRDIVDWCVVRKPISESEKYWTDYYENIGK